MKLPKSSIYWECIGSYLELQDYAKFDTSLTNHNIRQQFNLQPAFSSKVEEGEEDSAGNGNGGNYNSHNAYSKLYSFNQGNVQVSLLSQEMENWCNKRKVIMKNLIVKYRPNIDKRMESEISRWDLYHYVEKISIPHLYLSIDLVELITRLHSLRVFSYWTDKCYNSTIQALITNHRNHFITSSSDGSIISSGTDESNDITPTTTTTRTIICLEEIRLTARYVSADALNDLIISIPTIKRFKFGYEWLRVGDNSGLRDDHLPLIAHYWRELNHINIYNRRIWDSGLISFRHTGQKFKHVKISLCRGFTITGLSYFLWNSTHSLTELILRTLSITEEEILSLLPQFKQLQVLEVDDFTNQLLYCVSTNCPNLIKLIRVRSYDDTSITDHGIVSLTNGCKYIEVLILGVCSQLRNSSIELLATTYRYTLKEIVIRIRNYPNPILFKDCIRKVKLPQ